MICDDLGQFVHAVPAGRYIIQHEESVAGSDRSRRDFSPDLAGFMIERGEYDAQALMLSDHICDGLRQNFRG